MKSCWRYCFGLTPPSSLSHPSISCSVFKPPSTPSQNWVHAVPMQPSFPFFWPPWNKRVVGHSGRYLTTQMEKGNGSLAYLSQVLDSWRQVPCCRLRSLPTLEDHCFRKPFHILQWAITQPAHLWESIPLFTQLRFFSSPFPLEWHREPVVYRRTSAAEEQRGSRWSAYCYTLLAKAF